MSCAVSGFIVQLLCNRIYRHLQKALRKMHMLPDYLSDSYSSENSDNEVNVQNSVCVEKEIHARTVRQVYLITYGQADESRFPTRRSFADAVLFSFDETPAEVT